MQLDLQFSTKVEGEREPLDCLGQHTNQNFLVHILNPTNLHGVTTREGPEKCNPELASDGNSSHSASCDTDSYQKKKVGSRTNKKKFGNNLREGATNVACAATRQQIVIKIRSKMTN